MRTTAVLLTILLMLPSLALGAAPRHAAPLSARQAFALIPTEIFENTCAPLTEDERELLADQGVNAHWSIAEDSPDALRFSSADGFPDVCLRLFRSERGAVAAFRTEDDDGVCISELWYISAKGHAAPLPLPPEPPVDDFFRPERDLPGRLSSSCTYCVFDRGLEVLPSFASDGVPCTLNPDNAVYYLWNGRTFVKKVKKINKQQ
ncbi:hypothetical protein [uncultured Mailhella sp.]|uniref:hypothetical protein n=1 Tax=uncultured Mailhella sp. TaxID=1981031 RepID=UPI0025FB477A|nr:hypothetical protein [uncultured Mailhella sp.]